MFTRHPSVDNKWCLEERERGLMLRIGEQADEENIIWMPDNVVGPYKIGEPEFSIVPFNLIFAVSCLVYTARWMNLKNIMLSKRNFTQKNIYSMVPFIWSSRVGKANLWAPPQKNRIVVVTETGRGIEID